MLRRVNERVGFGRMSASDAGRQYIAEANSILACSR